MGLGAAALAPFQLLKKSSSASSPETAGPEFNVPSMPLIKMSLGYLL